MDVKLKSFSKRFSLFPVRSSRAFRTNCLTNGSLMRGLCASNSRGWRKISAGQSSLFRFRIKNRIRLYGNTRNPHPPPMGRFPSAVAATKGGNSNRKPVLSFSLQGIWEYFECPIIGRGAMLESYSKPSCCSISRAQSESLRMDHSGALYPFTGQPVIWKRISTAFLDLAEIFSASWYKLAGGHIHGWQFHGRHGQFFLLNPDGSQL